MAPKVINLVCMHLSKYVLLCWKKCESYSRRKKQKVDQKFCVDIFGSGTGTFKNSNIKEYKISIYTLAQKKTIRSNDIIFSDGKVSRLYSTDSRLRFNKLSRNSKIYLFFFAKIYASTTK